MVQVSLQFDPAVVLMSWKSLGKLVCHVKDRPRLLGNGCHGYHDIVRELCNTMLVKGREAVEATTGGVSYCSLNFSFLKHKDFMHLFMYLYIIILQDNSNCTIYMYMVGIIIVMYMYILLF